MIIKMPGWTVTILFTATIIGLLFGLDDLHRMLTCNQPHIIRIEPRPGPPVGNPAPVPPPRPTAKLFDSSDIVGCESSPDCICWTKDATVVANTEPCSDFGGKYPGVASRVGAPGLGKR